jgi:hypothetical protein
MERDTTIPSILSPMDGPARSPKPANGGRILKIMAWGALAFAALLLVRHVYR